MQELTPNALWRLPTVMQVTGLGRSSIYERMKAAEFPQAIHLGGGPMVAWIRSEVLDWVDEQIRVSRSCTKRAAPQSLANANGAVT